MNISDVITAQVATEACKKITLTFSALWEGKSSFFSEWDNRAWKKDCITGALHHYRIKRRTMKIVSDLSLLTDWLDVTFALDVLALVVGGGAGPGAAHAEHDDQEQDGRGGPDQNPYHYLEYRAWVNILSWNPFLNNPDYLPWPPRPPAPPPHPCQSPAPDWCSNTENRSRWSRLPILWTIAL